MKPLFFSLTMILTTLFATAQVEVEGVNINELDITFCQIIGINKSMFGTNIVINVSYGQKMRTFSTQQIKGPDGRPVEFNSMVDALNFMEANGWQYVSNYAVGAGQGSVYTYLLRKK